MTACDKQIVSYIVSLNYSVMKKHKTQNLKWIGVYSEM